jgi:hypothetical protein
MDAMYPNPNLNGTPRSTVPVPPPISKTTQLSSFFMSLDGCAEECVSYDFLNYTVGKNWGDGYVQYVASNNGGVYDRWDANYKYAKDRDPNANGIELKLVRPDLNSPGALAFSSATYSVGENGGSATITVTRNNGSTGQVGVNYATSNGTATAGSDYTAVNGTLTFAAGVTSQTFAVPIINDDIVEGNETVNLTLTNPTGGATLGSPSTATLTIADDDQGRITLPGRIQAEDYMNGGEGVGYHDADAGNTGGQYRTDGVDIEVCSDAGGGYDVGWTNAGEWLAYNVKVTTAGSYQFVARVASGTAGTKSIQVSVDGVNVGGQINFTSAAGWQSWVDAASATATLTAGNHTLRITMVTGGLNLNHLDVNSVTPPNNPPTVAITSPANNAHFTNDPSSVIVTANASDADGSVAKVDFYNGVTLAGTVTAAPYTWTYSLAAGTYTLKATATDDKGASSSASVTVSVGNYPPVVSISSPSNGANFTPPATVTVTATASDADGTVGSVELFNNNVSAGALTASPYQWTLANLAAGSYSLKAVATDDKGATATSTIAITVTDQGRIALPGRIQAEDYMTGGEGVGYHDADAGNTGGKYRTDGVDIETCSDAGGGYDVGWTNAGEWLAYNVSVAQAGSYQFVARVASANAGTKSIQVSIDGANVGGQINFTTAAGWQSWVDAVSASATLTAGNHTLRITMVTAGLNLNYLDVKTVGPQPIEIAKGKPATSSSVENATYPASNAVDGNMTTRWSSAFSDPQWITIDLGASYAISAVALNWEGASGKNYTIRLSSDNASWTTLATKTNMAAGARLDSIGGLSGTGRYIQMNGTVRTTVYGYSLFDFRVYGTSSGAGLGGAIGATSTISPERARTSWNLGIAGYAGGAVHFTLPRAGAYELAVYTLTGAKACGISGAGASSGPVSASLNLQK